MEKSWITNGQTRINNHGSVDLQNHDLHQLWFGMMGRLRYIVRANILHCSKKMRVLSRQHESTQVALSHSLTEHNIDHNIAKYYLT